MTDVTEIAYPPIQSQATQTFIDDNVLEADRTGSMIDDFKVALANILSVDVNAYSIDDLWALHIRTNFPGDANLEAGAPAGRTPFAFGGMHPAHNYSQAYLRNPNNANTFPGGSGGGGGGSDPHFASVTNLVAFDDASGTDDSNAGATATFNGTAAVSSTVTRYGNDTLELSATDSVTFPDIDGYSIANDPGDDSGTGDFTVELDVYFPIDPVASSASMIGKGVTNNGLQEWSFGLNANTVRVIVSTSGSNGIIVNTGTFNPAAATWYTICWEVERAVPSQPNDVTRIYVDGVMVESTANIQAHAALGNRTDVLQIGGATRWETGYAMNIANVRITKGVARYQGVDYTAPTAPYPTS